MNKALALAELLKSRSFTLAGAGAAALVIAAVAITREADAQRVDPRKPSVFVVGAANGPSPTFRGDSHRTGTTKELLPSGVLHIAWRKSIGLNVDQPALVAADGSIAVVSTAKGDVVFFDPDGDEKARASASNASVGPATTTSDGTVVFTTSLGDVVGVRRSSPRPRFTTRIGGERNIRTAPLSLDDGGVVVANGSDLVVLDAEGNVRARVSLPESPGSPLLSTGDRVIAVALSGNVYAWTPGREPVRVGSFGAPIDGGAALADPSTLVAVIETNHLVDLDLSRGALSTRSITTQGLYLGPPSVRAVRGAGGDSGTSATTLATVLSLTPNRLFAITLDPGGLEVARAPVQTLAPQFLGDGGPKPLEVRRHSGTLVDARGAVAFITTDGHVGVALPDGAVDTVGELLCARGSGDAGVAGLSPAGRGAFLVTCESGAIAKITGAEPESLRRLSPSTSPARPAGTSSPAVPKPDEDDDER